MTKKIERAWSTFVIKEINEDARTIEGIASTPATDRMNDIVDSKGAEFKLPLPLLWQHDSGQPIGWVDAAKVTAKGITIKAHLAKAGVLEEIDKAWVKIREGLVRGLSIGFRPLTWEEMRTEDGYGIHFKTWEWLELSAVTIPANQEATITSVKQFDFDPSRSAALGTQVTKTTKADNLANPNPGASGTRKTLPKMKSLAERIAALEAKRAATVAAMEAMIGDEDQIATLTDEQKNEYDQLDAEVREIDETLRRFKRAQEISVQNATRVTATAGQEAAPVGVTNSTAGTPAQQALRLPAQQVVVRSNLAPGVKFARYAMALKRAHGNLTDALNATLSNKSWMDTSPEVAQVLRAAVAAGDTTTSGWASELVYAQNLQAEFIEYLRPQTIMGRIPNWRFVPFNMRVGSQTAGSTGYWVGQGAPVPMSSLTTSSATLGITKAAGLVALDDELVRSSSPSAELLVRDDLSASIAYLLDRSLIDPTQGGSSNVQPAALTYGITPVTPTGTDYAALKADFKSLTSNMITNNQDLGPCVWVMSQTIAQALSLMVTSLGVPQFPQMTSTGGTLFGFPVIVSQSAYFSSGSPDYGNMMVLINPREVFVADDGQVVISISNEASIQMLDNPTNASTGGTVATTMVSMFQTNSEAIKAVRYINWARRRTNAVAFIRNALYA